MLQVLITGTLRRHGDDEEQAEGRGAKLPEQAISYRERLPSVSSVTTCTRALHNNCESYTSAASPDEHFLQPYYVTYGQSPVSSSPGYGGQRLRTQAPWEPHYNGPAETRLGREANRPMKHISSIPTVCRSISFVCVFAMPCFRLHAVQSRCFANLYNHRLRCNVLPPRTSKFYTETCHSVTSSGTCPPCI